MKWSSLFFVRKFCAKIIPLFLLSNTPLTIASLAEWLNFHFVFICKFVTKVVGTELELLESDRLFLYYIRTPADWNVPTVLDKNTNLIIQIIARFHQWFRSRSLENCTLTPYFRNLEFLRARTFCRLLIGVDDGFSLIRDLSYLKNFRSKHFLLLFSKQSMIKNEEKSVKRGMKTDIVTLPFHFITSLNSRTNTGNQCVDQ